MEEYIGVYYNALLDSRGMPYETKHYAIRIVANSKKEALGYALEHEEDSVVKDWEIHGGEIECGVPGVDETCELPYEFWSE